MASFTIVDPSTRDHIEAARLANKCLTAGVSASGPDCLIAVLAVSGGHELSAMDEAFRTLARHAPLKLFKVPGVTARARLP